MLRRRMELGAPVPNALTVARVLAPDGTAIALGSLWAARDALVVFVRHFACAGCSAHVSALQPRLGELAALGVEVALVGSGDPAQLAAFVERNLLSHLPVRAYTDPSRAAYAAAGLSRSVWGTIGPVAVVQLLAALGQGHVNGRPEGDLYQQGGTLYVAQGGTLALYHRARNLGDHAPVVDVVELAMRRRARSLGAT